MPHGCILHMFVFLEGAFIITHSFVGLFIQSPDWGPALSLHHRSGWICCWNCVQKKKERKNMDMPCEQAKWKYYAFFLYHRHINLTVGPCNQAAPAPKEVNAQTYQLLWCEIWKCDKRQRKHWLSPEHELTQPFEWTTGSPFMAPANTVIHMFSDWLWVTQADLRDRKEGSFPSESHDRGSKGNRV